MSPEPAPAATTSSQRAPAPRWLPLAPWLFVLLWSGGYTPVRIAVEDCPPLLLLALRYGGVLLLLVPAYLVVRPPLPRSPREWFHLAFVGLLIQGIYFGLCNFAIQRGASAAGLAIVLAMQPILVALAVPRFAGEAVGRNVWAGLLLGLAGAVVVVLAKSSLGGATAAGIAIALIALLFITAGTLWEKRFGVTQHPIVANIVQCGIAGALALAAAAAVEPFEVRWTWPLFWSLAYLVIANSIVAMTLLLAMVRYGQATKASALFFLVPPVSALIAWLILGEPLSPVTWVGMAVAGFGVWLVRGR